LVTYKGDKNNMALLWNKYKYFLLAGLVVLLVLGFFFVRKRVKQSQEII
jgi:LPXTG-motif cell wall-anchored protein